MVSGSIVSRIMPIPDIPDYCTSEALSDTLPLELKVTFKQYKFSEYVVTGKNENMNTFFASLRINNFRREEVYVIWGIIH